MILEDSEKEKVYTWRQDALLRTSDDKPTEFGFVCVSNKVPMQENRVLDFSEVFGKLSHANLFT